MSAPEYIRTRSEPSSSTLLSVPDGDGTARLTFLHAGRSHWSDDDTGRSAPAERGHSHPVYHAVLYTSGRNEMIHDGRILPFRRGTLILTDPGSTHEYRPRNPGGGSFLEITFNVCDSDGEPVLSGWDSLLSTWLGRGIPAGVWPAEPGHPHLERLESAMDEVIGKLVSGDVLAEEEAAVRFGGFVVEVGRFLLETAESPGEEEPDRLEAARRILERHYASRISIAELAAEAFLSEGAFIRQFSSRYGMPPISYRKHLRITAAQHLLSVSGRSIGEIASTVGYGDIFAFSRSFKAVTGKTPTRWRREARGLRSG